MKLDIILQEKGQCGERDVAYLRVEIVDLSNSSIDVASMDSLSYLYAG
jgi:hypothetical protein